MKKRSLTFLIALLIGNLVFLALMVNDSFNKMADARSKNHDEREGCLVDRATLKDVREREKKVHALKKEIDKKQKELDEKALALDEEFKKLDELRKEVAAQKDINDKKQEEKVAKIVETFEKMSPKSAATLLSSLNDQLAVVAMARISTPKLAKIMNIMDKKRLSGLTELMAGSKSRRRSPTSNGGE